MDPKKRTIEIASRIDSTNALGPGIRYVIWVQGCNKLCSKCIAPEYKIVGRGQVITVSELANDILAELSIDGLTISGGEPMLQAEALAELVSILRIGNGKLDYILYTGYEIDEIKNCNEEALFNSMDLVITGEYIDDLNYGKGLAGSVNQNYHFLSTKLIEKQEEISDGVRSIELLARHAGKLELIGIPDKELHDILNKY